MKARSELAPRLLIPAAILGAAALAFAAPASITYDTRGNISQICTATTCAAQGKNCGTIRGHRWHSQG